MKRKVKIDEQSCRSEHLIPLYKLGKQIFKDIAAQIQHGIFDYHWINLYKKFYAVLWRLSTFKKKTDKFFQTYFMSLHKFHTQYYFLSDSDTLFCEYIVVPEVLLFWLMESNQVIER